MYNLNEYAQMVADRVRLEAYLQALRQIITPDSVVVDLGAGTGIIALLACKCGARRVYAFEPSDAIELARESARDNGFADRIVAIQDYSSRASLSEKADIIVESIGGVLPQFQHHILDVADARERFLAPRGRIVPGADTLWAAIVEAPDLYSSQMEPWQNNPFGLDLRSGLRFVPNMWQKARFKREQLLSEPSSWGRVNYASVVDPNVRGEMTWQANRSGTAHGLALWFDSDLGEGIRLSNAPGAPQLVYGQAFFPWPQAVSVVEGDVVDARVRADLVGEAYVWSWESTIRRKASPDLVELDFRQSTFLGIPLTKQGFAKRSSRHMPLLNNDGRCARFLLDRMEGTTPLDDLARQTLREFPGRFRSLQHALSYTAELSVKYS